MSDMTGTVRSNWIEVKDLDAFVVWFEEDCYFGDEIEVWFYDRKTSNLVAFGGYEMYPSAYPRMRLGPELYELSGDVRPEWDLKAFAKEVRKHLAPEGEFRVIATGNDKLKYVAAQHLVITHKKAKFTDLYEGI